MKGKYYSPSLKVLIFVIDFWLIDLAFHSARMFGFSHSISGSEYTTFFLVFSFIWIIAGFFNKIYRIDSLSLTKNIRNNLFKTATVHLLLVLIILTFFPVYKIHPEFLSTIYTASAALIIGSRILFKLILKYFEFSGFNHR